MQSENGQFVGVADVVMWRETFFSFFYQLYWTQIYKNNKDQRKWDARPMQAAYPINSKYSYFKGIKVNSKMKETY